MGLGGSAVNVHFEGRPMDDATRQKLIAELGNVMQLFEQAISEEKAKSGNSAPSEAGDVAEKKSLLPSLIEGQKQIRALMAKLG
jgi:hypothetical protein